MAINIELRPDLERRLAEQARAQGMTLSSYLESLLGNGPGLMPHATDTSSAEEWSRELQRWAEEFPGQAPLLSDEAISRDSIYGDEE